MNGNFQLQKFRKLRFRLMKYGTINLCISLKVNISVILISYGMKAHNDLFKIPMKNNCELSPRKKQHVFSYTSSDQQKSVKKSNNISNHTNAERFILNTVAKYSIKQPFEFLRTTHPSVLSSHLKTEINFLKKEIKEIKKRDSYIRHQELLIRRNITANELLRLENENSQLSNDSSLLSSKVSNLFVDIKSPKSTLILNESISNQEDISRLKSIIQTQHSALMKRKEREFIHKFGPVYKSVLIAETEKLQKKTAEIKEKIKIKRINDNQAILKLINSRSEAIETIEQHFNTNNQDIVVNMKDLIQYAKKNDPIILYQQFLREKFEDIGIC